MLSQIIKVIKLLGLSPAVRMKRHHDKGLSYIRGYAVCSCWWALLNNGFLDTLDKQGQVDLEKYCREHGWHKDALDAIVEYLDGVGLLTWDDGQVSITKDGRVLLAEPRGMFELLWAYEPCFGNLGELLKGSKKYGRDLTRDVTYVGIGSGRLCEQLPYRVMRRMVLDHGCRGVLDLGCGDMAFLGGLCQLDPEIKCHGIDFSEDMVRYNVDKLARADYGGRLSVQQGDMFDLPKLPENVTEIDCITACDTFHEYLDQENRLVELLRNLRRRFPRAIFVIGEFCLQDRQWLRRHPTAALEHHLFHQLSGQQIGTSGQWRDIFLRTGLEIIEEQIFDLIGHGYFALR